MPGPHIQTLLELLLSATSVLDEELKELKKKEREKLKNVPEFILDSYMRYRDGPSVCSTISLTYEQIQKSKTLCIPRDSHNRYMVDDFVGDVCVRGGKWYYEVKFVGQCQYGCVGWINRKHRKRSNSGISNDVIGNAWCVSGPNTQFMHRSRVVQPYSKDNAFVRPNWSGGVVVGCMLNLDDSTMEFTFDGEESGIAFSGFDVSEGLYPAVSLNQNSQCIINFGAEPFSFPPNEKDEYCPLEHADIQTSSWLTRYKVYSTFFFLYTFLFYCFLLFFCFFGLLIICMYQCV